MSLFGTFDNIVRSTDNGVTWLPYSSLPFIPHDIALDVDDRLYAASEFGAVWYEGTAGSVESDIHADGPTLGVWPNPLSIGDAVVRYSLPHPGHVSIVLYDMFGRELHTLMNGQQESGQHTLGFR